MRPWLPVLLAAALGGGCVLKHSTPARLFVLDAMAPAAPATTAPVGVVGVQRVVIPGWIDRPEITGRGAAGEVVVEPAARWGEPLGRGLQRVVVENLAALLPDRHVAGAPFAPRQQVDHHVEITFVEAARQADGTVLVDARWRILDAKGGTLVQRRSTHRARPAAGGSGTAAGLGEALASLCGEIADAVRTLPPAP